MTDAPAPLTAASETRSTSGKQMLRPLTSDDAPAITDILTAMERAEPVDEAYSERDVQEELSAPRVDLLNGSVAVLESDRLVGFGLLQLTAPSDTWKATIWGGVHPDHVDRGIGRRIIEESAAQARAIRDADAPGRPGELKVWVEDTRPRTAGLTAAMGFQTWRYFFRMLRDLTDPVPNNPDPPGVTIRGYQATDEENVRQVSNAAFGDHWGSTPQTADQWRAEYSGSPSFRPDHSRVAVVDGVLAGFIVISEFEAETRQRGYSTGYFARVATLRAARGRGVASALMAHTLAALQAAGYRYADLVVDADSPTGAGRIYERAGFKTVNQARVVGRRF